MIWINLEVFIHQNIKEYLNDTELKKGFVDVDNKSDEGQQKIVLYKNIEDDDKWEFFVIEDNFTYVMI